MIRLKFITKSEFLCTKAMGKAMNPYFSVPIFCVKPHACLRQPGLWPEFI